MNQSNESPNPSPEATRAATCRTCASDDPKVRWCSAKGHVAGPCVAPPRRPSEGTPCEICPNDLWHLGATRPALPSFACEPIDPKYAHIRPAVPVIRPAGTQPNENSKEVMPNEDRPKSIHKTVAVTGDQPSGERAGTPLWIPVSERLPRTNEPVLFGWWNTPRNSSVGHYCIEIGVHLAEEEYWECERTAPQDEPIRFQDKSEEVTHWMPLPDPPKEKP
jgi:hypothetical protein